MFACKEICPIKTDYRVRDEPGWEKKVCASVRNLELPIFRLLMKYPCLVQSKPSPGRSSLISAPLAELSLRSGNHTQTYKITN